MPRAMGIAMISASTDTATVTMNRFGMPKYIADVSARFHRSS